MLSYRQRRNACSWQYKIMYETNPKKANIVKEHKDIFAANDAITCGVKHPRKRLHFLTTDAKWEGTLLAVPFFPPKNLSFSVDALALLFSFAAEISFLPEQNGAILATMFLHGYSPSVPSDFSFWEVFSKKLLQLFRWVKQFGFPTACLGCLNCCKIE